MSIRTFNLNAPSEDDPVQHLYLDAGIEIISVGERSGKLTVWYEEADIGRELKLFKFVVLSNESNKTIEERTVNFEYHGSTFLCNDDVHLYEYHPE